MLGLGAVGEIALADAVNLGWADTPAPGTTWADQAEVSNPWTVLD